MEKLMKNKLLVTASTFPRWEEDTEPRFVLDLCKALAEYFDVTVLVPWAIGAKKREKLEGVEVIRYHYFPIHRFETLCYPGAIVPRIKEKKLRVLLVPFLAFSLWFNLFKLLPKYDYVHVHWLIPQGLIQSLFKKKYIITGHGADVCSFNSGLMLKAKRYVLKKASTVAVVSKHLENVVKAIDPDISPVILPMGCWVDNFSEKFKKENYYQQGCKKVILFVGRLAEKKGVTYLIEAMKSVDAKLVIVGNGPLEMKLKEQAAQQNDKIIFLGAKTHEELKVLYASADIFVAPSVTAKNGDQEGFGLVLLEAMASGLPVIASKSGGITDIITDGENGLLVEEKNPLDLAEKLNRLLNDKGLYNKIKGESLNTAARYDYKKIGREYAKLIKNLDS